ncbi:Imm1 family immunity protein [Micromonospora sp. NPDC049257]|uniref:Imm1 family immunity protein n=1 Tax=Micromonospora sp. NPDC049257 TaxID=3155771 RepID=UPI00341E50B8
MSTGRRSAGCLTAATPPTANPTHPVTVHESPDTGPVDVPAARARVTPAAARSTAVEYVATGQRPTGMRWVHEVQPG